MSQAPLAAPVGISDFKELITSNYYHVDKTLLIKEIIDDGAEVISLPRPRRFGKTINMSMLKYFFDINNGSQDIFDGLKIQSAGEKYTEQQGKYPVIFISLKEVKDKTYDQAQATLVSLISGLFREHKYLLESDKLDDVDKKEIESIINRTANATQLATSLGDLSRYLSEHFELNPFIIIDEYDAPIVSAIEHDYVESMLIFMKQFLGFALKDNHYLHKGILTGIMRISKESIFSGINNVAARGMISNRYGEYFGFEEQEVVELLEQRKDLNAPDISEIRSWYNGYVIAGKVVYNPWSIISFIDEDYEFKPYWLNTSDNYLIKKAFSKAPVSIKKLFEQLIQGEVITREVEESVTVDDLAHLREQAIWTLLCLSGYLKIVSSELIKGRAICKLAVPNLEVLTLYEKFIERWFSDTLDVDEYHSFLSSLMKGDVESFYQYLSRFVKESTSHFDVQQKQPERVYHSLVLGMIVGMRDKYTIKSNHESGFGRYDVILIPVDKNQLGIIIEFKTAPAGNDAALEKTADEALQQVQDKAYRTELEQLGVTKILELGLAFAGKRVVYRVNHIEVKP